MVRVALAGSRDLPLDRTARHVLVRLAGLPDGSSVLLRRPKTAGRPPGGFERLVAKLAATIGLSVVWCAPEGTGREQVFLRDLDMVARSDFVVAYFSMPTMDGGTGHVVEAAWSKGVWVEAEYISPDGEALRIGEYNPATDGP